MVENPAVTSIAKHVDSYASSISHLRHDIQRGFDDLQSLITSAKPVSFTSDDILPPAMYYQHSTTATLSERASVKVDIMSHTKVEDIRFNKDSSVDVHCQALSDISTNTQTCQCVVCKSTLPSNSDKVSTVLFSTTSHYCVNKEIPKDGPSAQQLHDVRERIEKTVSCFHIFIEIKIFY